MGIYRVIIDEHKNLKGKPWELQTESKTRHCQTFKQLVRQLSDSLIFVKNSLETKLPDCKKSVRHDSGSDRDWFCL